MSAKTRTFAKQARWFRKFHRYIAIPLMVFLLLIGISGLLLTWKNELQLNPPTSTVEKTQQPISLHNIEEIAQHYADSLTLDNTINRIDYRPTKGIVKIRFEHHLTEIQINCYTGEVVSAKQRTADLIEMIHDGSIIDFLFKSESENIKLLYSTLTSLGLILLALSGYFMWRKPKQIKRLKRESLTSR